MRTFKPLLSIVAASVVFGATIATALANEYQGGAVGGARQGGQGGMRGQGNPGGPPPGQGQHQQGMFHSIFLLIKMPSVQQHLQLTQQQIQAVNALQPPPPPQGGGPGGGGPGGPPPGGGPGNGGPGGGGPGGPPPGGGPGNGGPGGGGPGGPPPGGGPGNGGPGGGQAGGPLAQILNQVQMKRLHQLALQFDAPMTFLGPPAGPALQLTQEQRLSIHNIIQTTMPHPQPGQQPPTWAEMQAAKANAFQQAWAKLTQTQKTKWGEITGPAFTNWQEPPHPNP